MKKRSIVLLSLFASVSVLFLNSPARSAGVARLTDADWAPNQQSFKIEFSVARNGRTVTVNLPHPSEIRQDVELVSFLSYDNHTRDNPIITIATTDSPQLVRLPSKVSPVYRIFLQEDELKQLTRPTNASVRFSDGAGNRTLNINIVPDSDQDPPYVSLIRVEPNRVREGNTVTFEVRLTRPVPQLSSAALRTAAQSTTARPRRASSRSRQTNFPVDHLVLSWRIVERASCFEQAEGSTPYRTNGLNAVSIPPGDQTRQLTIRAQDTGCTGVYSIETWVGNTNTRQSPNFVSTSFRVED